MVKHILSGFGFLSGASYPFRALALVYRNPRLRSYLIVPIAINFVLGIGIYLGLLLWGWQLSEGWLLDWTAWVDNAIAQLPAWLAFLEAFLVGLALILRVLASVLLLAITGFVLAQFGVLLGAPWYGQLSEQVEKLRRGRAIAIEVGILKDLGRAVLFELKKLGLVIFIGLPLLLLNLIPGFGTLVSTLGGLGLTATLVCLDFLDAPLERRRLKFRQKLGLIGRSLPASLGFSLVCLLLISIPLLNLLTIPLCVTAGTLFFCDRIDGRLLPATSDRNSE